MLVTPQARRDRSATLDEVTPIRNPTALVSSSGHDPEPQELCNIEELAGKLELGIISIDAEHPAPVRRKQLNGQLTEEPKTESDG